MRETAKRDRFDHWKIFVSFRHSELLHSDPKKTTPDEREQLIVFATLLGLCPYFESPEDFLAFFDSLDTDYRHYGYDCLKWPCAAGMIQDLRDMVQEYEKGE